MQRLQCYSILSISLLHFIKWFQLSLYSEPSQSGSSQSKFLHLWTPDLKKNIWSMFLVSPSKFFHYPNKFDKKWVFRLTRVHCACSCCYVRISQDPFLWFVFVIYFQLSLDLCMHTLLLASKGLISMLASPHNLDLHPQDYSRQWSTFTSCFSFIASPSTWPNHVDSKPNVQNLHCIESLLPRKTLFVPCSFGFMYPV